jgi:TQXA domain-containing protein
VHRRGAVRRAAATLLTGLLTAGVLGTGVLTAAPAAAEEDGAPQVQGGAAATLGGLKIYGTAVVHADGGDQEVAAGLFEMSVDGGGTLQTYGVDLHAPTQRDARYHEMPWSGTSLGANKDAGRIRWILQHSYPQVNDLAALARQAGAQGLTEQDAAAGTQVAIWRFSDHADVEAADPQAEKLADYLVGSARKMPEPQASLVLDPPAVSGHPGERIGPVTVHTNAGGVTVTPPVDAAISGVRIVDAAGRAVTSAADGSRLYVEVPADAADGSAELTVQASTTVPVGRALVSDSRSQTQILAGSSESTVSAAASAAWAEQGAIPALSAARNCAEGALEITAVNKGDEEFAFELMGVRHSIAAGASRVVTVPLQEDQPYDFSVSGPHGFRQRFAGVLDCRTQSSASGLTAQTLSEPSPATAGLASDGTDLAETGGSAVTPLIAGVAIGLVLIGGTVLLLLRGRSTADRG